jgi:ElaB/YqjD/DUF883 family membrane-anchored ribosome-binding protein
MQPTMENESSNLTDTSDASHEKSEAIDRFACTAHRAVDRIAQGADSALRSLRDSSHDWRASGDETLDQLQGYVREKPLTALALAAAAGFLLSRLMR